MTALHRIARRYPAATFLARTGHTVDWGLLRARLAAC